MREALRSVLADTSIRALADLKVRMLEVIEGDAPEDWADFLAFAARATVTEAQALRCRRTVGSTGNPSSTLPR